GEIHYCAEMYTRMSNRYLGSTRNRYCNWQFFEYIIHQMGVKAVNDLWLPPGSNISNHDPMSELMRRNSLSQSEFNDIFGDFAMKSVIWDINQSSKHPVAAYAGRGSAQFRAAFNKNLNPNEMLKRPRYTYLESLDSTDGENGRFVSPFAVSPQRYAYNIVRLYPDQPAGVVTVRFRGDVQTKNNIPNYAKSLNLEPVAANLPDNPGSDWRYGLVAVTGDAASATGTVTARYSDLMRASDGSPNVSIDMKSGEAQLYLVVAATPTVHHRISWDQFDYTIYRFPYMVEVSGAKPEGFQAPSNPAGGFHANGGGFVQTGATVAATAYVGKNARVLGTARVEGSARVEGRAVVKGNARVSGSAVVKDYAMVAGGTVGDRAVVADGANIYNAQITGDARVDGAPNINNSNARVSGNARVGGTCWIDAAINISGTAQLLGDGEVYDVTATSGVYYGLVDAGMIGQVQFGGNRTQPPVEATKPRSMQWYEPATTSVRQSVTALSLKANSFRMTNRGVFTYNLGNGADNARLKMFDVRGRLVKTVLLTGVSGTVDTGVFASRMLFWRVEGAGGRVIGKAGSGAVVR
ncbi:MAG: DUF6055 domain-containing protein, partial [Chitinispirillia bacterium]|nr:DUF6055 domain-containing protein [Chitinispirillia bacterium]